MTTRPDIDLLPAERHGLSAAELDRLATRLLPAIGAHPATAGAGTAVARLLRHWYLPLAAALAQRCGRGGIPVVGINGAQGTGKSTLCALLRCILAEGFDLRATILGIDDLYLTHAERRTLAQTVHPLLATRGVPGTHDTALGMSLLDQLTDPSNRRPVALPAFDKARDDRRPQADWPVVTPPVDLVLFEGWCVGARPLPAAALREPANALERDEDAGGHWRRYVNQRLQGDYARLFARLDLLVMLAPPDFEQVFLWRRRQEQDLAARTGLAPGTAGVMTDAALRRFIMHYERLTRWMLAEMPSRADLAVRLGRDHAPAALLNCSARLGAESDNLRGPA